jgi:hypothetical protein
MSKRIFTQEQIAALLENKNVARVSEKSITYHADFKLAAVQRYHEGLPPSEIFQEAGFSLTLIGRETPAWLLKDWRNIFAAKGPSGLQNDERGKHELGGRRPALKNMSEKDRMKYLEAQVVYLKAENAFLAQLRKQRLNYGHNKNSESSDP